MESSSSFASTIVSFLCLAAMCLVPLAAVGGGVFFFVNRKKKSQAAALVNAVGPSQPAVAPYPSVPVVPVAPVAPVNPVQQQPVTQPVAVPVPQPVSVLVPQPVIRADTAFLPKTLPVSPSELVVLRGDTFSPAAGKFNWYEVLGTNVRVDLPTLTHAMFAAAFLALRETGDVRLEAGKRKATLGLREVNALYVVPTGSRTAWPEGSYEAQFLTLANELAAKHNNHVNLMVYRALGRDSKNPESAAVGGTCYALQKQGILSIVEQKGMLGIKTHKYAMPAETQAVLPQTQADVTAVQALLGRVRQSEPELWKLLESETKDALKSRVESDSGSDFPSSDF